MFDTIYCKYPLPDCSINKGELAKTDFQTKNLENCCYTFTIGEDGWLRLSKQIWESTPEDELPYKNHPNPVMRVCGSLRLKSERIVKYRHTGDVSFYTLVKNNTPYHTWIEFRAAFKNGKLKNVELVQDQIQYPSLISIIMR